MSENVYPRCVISSEDLWFSALTQGDAMWSVTVKQKAW